MDCRSKCITGSQRSQQLCTLHQTHSVTVYIINTHTQPTTITISGADHEQAECVACMHILVVLTLMCVYANTQKVQAQPIVDLRGSWSVVGQQCAVVTPQRLLSDNPQMIGQPLNVNITVSPPPREVPPTSTPSPFFFIHTNSQTSCPPAVNINANPCKVYAEEMGSQ